MRTARVLLLLLGLPLLLTVPRADAAIKLIVLVGTPNFQGADIVIPLTLLPFGQDSRGINLTPARADVTASTAMASLKTLLISRILAEYGVTLVPEEILIKGGFD